MLQGYLIRIVQATLTDVCGVQTKHIAQFFPGYNISFMIYGRLLPVWHRVKRSNNWYVFMKI